MRGILRQAASGALDNLPPLRWSESQAMRVDENAWRQVWRRLHQVRPVLVWQPWPRELARDWLGLDPAPAPPALPEYVRALLDTARPYLTTNR